MAAVKPLAGKKIILGVTGCIAAYKSCYLVRELIKTGAEVRVVISPSAAAFVSPLTLSTLSKNKVIRNIFPDDLNGNVEVDPWHIEYGIWADLVLIAPCSVNTLAKIASGFADNALTTLVTARRSPMIICPAADHDMYEYEITQSNIDTLRKRGVFIVDAEYGELASGLVGLGRFPEIQKIIDAVYTVLSGRSKDLSGKKIVVTAGPTYEDIDPVRYIGNRSSGKMGYEIAKAAFQRGAEVTLVSGPSHEYIYPEIETIKVRSASEMSQAVKSVVSKESVLVMAAAVADFTPATVSAKKIKKEITGLDSIQLTETEDILSAVGKQAGFVVGFALETDNEIVNALSKMERKGLDSIVLNSLNDAGSGFEFATNSVTILKRDGSTLRHPLQSKTEIAHLILDSFSGEI
ncbi:MAG: bifunctional phosphopantothenoylcysteine decarboxylase/phosphopantothenate--cysteine ligase CoaBC [Bacteroidetes bacterium]|nr:bifunctional phosphopantothenoylcysteine decarboxylase/phosphopantothenate--cysteine ligase CoaBC [Bacteroidota bacterium]